MKVNTSDEGTSSYEPYYTFPQSVMRKNDELLNLVIEMIDVYESTDTFDWRDWVKRAKEIIS